MGNQWGAQQSKKTDTPPAPTYGADYFRDLYSKASDTQISAPTRMALVGKENTAKTGLAIDFCAKEIKAGKKVVIFDFDNSAEATVDYVCRDSKGKRYDNVVILRLFDECDESIFNDDNSTNWVALIDKVEWLTNVVAEDSDGVAAVIFDGASTLLKWCEFAMTWVLQNRENNPIDPDNERFNQSEWRVRNKLFRNALNRVHSLPIQKVFFTFHLKDKKSFVDDGTGKKVLMTVGEHPDWVDGTQRKMSQQIFLARYMKNGDIAAGVSEDKSLADGEWVIRATVEEMKGFGTEHLGLTRTILQVKDGKVKWNGLPELIPKAPKGK